MFKSFVKRGQLLFLFSFLALIAIGTLLLKLPFVMKSGESLAWIDALFMATTSVCVTGLDCVGFHDFSYFGQFIIIALVELGGIGIMTLSASILLALGRGLSFSNNLMISHLNDNFSLRGTESLTRTVINYTLASELVGAIIIYIGCLADGRHWGVSLWHSILLSIAGFCNAGLSPFADSLESCGRIMQFGVITQAILGGLGVYVIYDLVEIITKRRNFMRVHSKVVLSATFFLLLAGSIAFRIFDLENGSKMTWFDAFFLSATGRTAGFSTVPVNLLSAESIAVLVVMMMIGVAPGGTGGGMKITAVALALAAIYSTISGSKDVLLFKRKMPIESILRSFAIIFIFVVYCGAGAFFLQMTGPSGNSAGANFFEAVSALTTTGLSFGVTGNYDVAGKLMLVALMYFGRIGPFTMLLFFVGREKTGHLQYPVERVVIG